jgi:hypothetical protein
MTDTIKRITIKNAVIIIVIMLLGLYIALAAVFSLSYIKDLPADKDAAVARFDSSFKTLVKRFEDEFHSINTNPTEIVNINGGIGSIRGFKTLEYVQKAPYTTRNRVEQALDEAADSLAPHLNSLSLQGEFVFKQFQDLETQLNNIFETGNTRFHNATKRLSAGLLTQYCEDLLTFMGEYQTVASTVMHHNLSDFRRNSQTLERLVDNALKSLDIIKSKLLSQDSLQSLTAATILNTNFLPRMSSYSVIGMDSATQASLVFPKEGAIGQDWGGIFRWLIAPIARSKNVDVLLICGMIGFGLFGAAIAIFITGTDLETDSAGSNLLLVIVRGFSAAIVVYLSARAGIAVVNSGNSDPNPLVLFLFCFIGAVFSERIWAWAKYKISDSFQDKTNPLGRR